MQEFTGFSTIIACFTQHSIATKAMIQHTSSKGGAYHGIIIRPGCNRNQKNEGAEVCDSFIRKYSAVWRKLLVFAQKHHMEELSCESAQVFFREESRIDIGGEEIYSVQKKKLHYMTVRPVLFLMILQNGIG